MEALEKKLFFFFSSPIPCIISTAAAAVVVTIIIVTTVRREEEEGETKVETVSCGLFSRKISDVKARLNGMSGMKYALI